jgi:hypothetical protein
MEIFAMAQLFNDGLHGDSGLAWYASYVAAILELNRESALCRIEIAHQEIRDRLAVLQLISPPPSLELRLLSDALNNLAILRRATEYETEGSLWD